MNSEVYRKLQTHLDRLPMGFPRTESGVELEILQTLFTPEEAEIACVMGLKPETTEAVAQRIQRDPGEMADMLERMSKKGLIFRTEKEDRILYSGAAFVVGIWEYHVKRMDREFAKKKARYLKEGFYNELHRGEGQSAFLRVIPVAKSVDNDLGVHSYEEVRSLIRQQKLISVTDCICRVKAGLLGNPCKKPVETCLAFGAGAKFYIDNGWGREISVDEALSIMDSCDREGLVLSPSNSQRPVAVCACCSCCCDFLHSLKRFERPALVANAAFCARVDEAACEGCETCVDRCQMEAIDMDDGLAVVHSDRCIGCGLCVSTCPAEALKLVRRDEARTPPEHIGHFFKQLGEERGKV